MNRFIQRLHARIGDFWWYSLMIFVACRTGDAIQAFIGLYLVPRYVGTEELGAVMPLQSLASLFAAPLGIIAVVFAKYVNVYATRGETGKVKCFIRDVIVASCLIFLGCIAAALIALPHFYERLRVTAGLLTVLILLAGFIGNISTLFTNALQGLKKFKTMSVVNILGAPVRLVTLLIAMPIRALSGYILGQATPPAASSLVAFLSLRRDFKGVPYDTSWRRDLGEMLRYAGPVAVWTIGGYLIATVHGTLIRQRMPEVESAAYYMLTRLSEIGGYLGASLLAVLFPLAAEAHEQGRENRRILRHAVLGPLLFSILLAIVFAIFARPLFGLVPIWRAYVTAAPLLVPLTLMTGVGMVIGSLVTYEMACRRFTPVWFVIAESTAWTVLLVCLMGHGFFRGILPDSIVDFMTSLRIANLSIFIWTNFANAIFQITVLGALLVREKKKRSAA